MNKFNNTHSTEARLRYLNGDFQIIVPGSYVTCAVSGKIIPLDELKYWNVERQEPYANGVLSHQRTLECNPDLRNRRKN